METVVDPVTAVEGERLMLTSVPVRKSDAKLTLEEANRLAAGRSFELIDGRIIFKMPDSKHSDAHGLLCGELVITPEDQRWVKDVLTCPEVLPGFSLNVQNIFAWPSPVSPSVE